ncbi:MAG: hypothetical protein KBG15_13915 [Kofleriaceae bacterium]|nr:hypothetical protein [Kofleriaceae bacterium]
MSFEQGTTKTSAGPTAQAKPENRSPRQPDSMGVLKLKAVIKTGVPDVQAVAVVLHAHPEDRNVLIGLLQTKLGNAFTLQVVNRLPAVAQAAASLVPNERLDKKPIRTWGLGGGNPTEVPLRRPGVNDAKQAAATPYAPVSEKQLAQSVAKAATARDQELKTGKRKSAALVTPEDGSSKVKAFHMAALGADNTGIEYPIAMARVGESEGFRVVLRCAVEDVAYINARLAKEKLSNVTLLPVAKGGDLDFWSEDQGEIHVDGSVSVPRRLGEKGQLPQAEITQAIHRDRVARMHPKSNADTSTPAGTAAALQKHPDVAFSGVGVVGERGGQRAIAAIAQSKGEGVRMSTGYLEGGNTLVGRFANGEGYAVIGKDSLAVSRAILEKERGQAVSDVELRSLIAADYGVKPQFLIAVEQPGDFHIDMHMMLLPNGHAAVNDSLQALALTTQWATEDMVNAKPKPLGPNATKSDQQQYKWDLEIWGLTSKSLASDLKAVASGAATRTRFETKMAHDLIAAGIKVDRIAGVFPAVRNFAPMNFLNGEHATNAKGERFSVVLGGDKRAEQHFVAALAQMPGAPQRVHFLDRSLTPVTLAASGGISCRAKIESMP